MATIVKKNFSSKLFIQKKIQTLTVAKKKLLIFLSIKEKKHALHCCFFSVKN
jgi:hypothetical protein